MRPFSLLSRAHTAGGSSRTRRRIIATVVVAACLMRFGALTAGDVTSAYDVSVREDQGVYSVTARFLVPQPPEAVHEVLTDYEGIPEFLPTIETSLVLEREPGRVVVRQEASSRFMLFSKRIHLLLEISEAPHHISFQDRSGQSFSRYEGSWCFNATERGTEVLYQLVADPAFDVPGFILKRLLQRDSEETIRRLRDEIALRAGAPAASARR